MLSWKPLLSIPECAKIAKLSVRRMRTIIEEARKKDPSIVQGSARRPMIKSEALGEIIGHSTIQDIRLDELEARLTYLEHLNAIEEH